MNNGQILELIPGPGTGKRNAKSMPPSSIAGEKMSWSPGQAIRARTYGRRHHRGRLARCPDKHGVRPTKGVIWIGRPKPGQRGRPKNSASAGTGQSGARRHDRLGRAVKPECFYRTPMGAEMAGARAFTPDNKGRSSSRSSTGTARTANPKTRPLGHQPAGTAGPKFARRHAGRGRRLSPSPRERRRRYAAPENGFQRMPERPVRAETQVDPPRLRDRGDGVDRAAMDVRARAGRCGSGRQRGPPPLVRPAATTNGRVACWSRW